MNKQENSSCPLFIVNPPLFLFDLPLQTYKIYKKTELHFKSF